MAAPTLDTIRIKVRKLTRSLTEAQLTTAQLDEYINTFVLYDFPEHLRLFNLRKTFDFYTEPFIDIYRTSDVLSSPLYDFKNKYISVHPPMYVGGYQVAFSESRDQLYQLYPKLAMVQGTNHTGDGITTTFRGIVTAAQGGITPSTTSIAGSVLLRNEVMFNSIDINGNALTMIDYPINSVEGNLYVPGSAPSSTTVPDPNNYINYISGVYVVTFTSAPLSGYSINSQTVPQQLSRPLYVCFFDGEFIVRPVPDQSYKVSMEVYAKPTELLNDDQQPELKEWWQYIAYGAAKKVFEDRMDLESVQQIMPEFTNQELLIQRRTIVQQTSQRTPTIYSADSNVAGAYGPGFFNGGSMF